MKRDVFSTRTITLTHDQSEAVIFTARNITLTHDQSKAVISVRALIKISRQTVGKTSLPVILIRDRLGSMLYVPTNAFLRNMTFLEKL
jgi:hypothetical protein